MTQTSSTGRPMPAGRLHECTASFSFAKRLFDVSLGLLMTCFALPVVGLAAVLIVAESGWPAIYRQTRVGMRGRVFEMYKLRSMPVGIEDETGPVFSRSGDNRPTRIGRLLRNTCIDELPQLLNVMQGDMSIVGPRPERPVFVEKFRQRIARYDERHAVRPGITGYAQVKMRCDGISDDPAEKLRLDLFYIAHWSLAMDISVVFKTCFAVLLPRRGSRVPAKMQCE